MTQDPDRSDAAATRAGHAFYTSGVLAVYDPAILGFFSRAAWRCPAGRVLDHYNQHVSGNHLDVGVGTGWFLDKAQFPTPTPRLALMDLNETCLGVAAERVARYSPSVHRADVLAPITLDVAPFDSVSLSYLLHCLPGTIHTKAAALDHLIPLTNPGGTIFGTTLLHDGVRRSWLARRVMAYNNARGIFSNAEDDLVGLHTIVRERLDEPTVAIRGCVALFSGRRRPSDDVTPAPAHPRAQPSG